MTHVIYPEIQSWLFVTLENYAKTSSIPFQTGEDHELETLGDNLAILIGEDSLSVENSVRSHVEYVNFTLQIFDFTPSFSRAKSLGYALISHLPNCTDSLPLAVLGLQFLELKTNRIAAPEGRVVVLKFKLTIAQ